jgi:hypothetical protein
MATPYPTPMLTYCNLPVGKERKEFPDSECFDCEAIYGVDVERET